MKYVLLKKIAFFWIIFHCIAYASFALSWTPSFTKEEKYTGKYKNITDTPRVTNYILTPKYAQNVFPESKHNMFFPDCYDCGKYTEEDNFHPFHDFTYRIYHQYSPSTNKYTDIEGFVGIFGFYGNSEFIVYVIIPLLIWLVVFLYKKIFRKTRLLNNI